MKYFFHISKGSLTCRKILRHRADGFTNPPKEGVLQISVDPLPSNGFELSNLGPNGKHANDYITDDEQ
jgi:hypothetical protein